MAHDVALIATIATGFALAFVIGFAASRLGLPPLAGYLVAGVLVGPSTRALWPTAPVRSSGPKLA